MYSLGLQVDTSPESAGCGVSTYSFVRKAGCDVCNQRCTPRPLGGDTLSSPSRRVSREAAKG